MEGGVTLYDNGKTKMELFCMGLSEAAAVSQPHGPRQGEGILRRGRPEEVTDSRNAGPVADLSVIAGVRHARAVQHILPAESDILQQRPGSRHYAVTRNRDSAMTATAARIAFASIFLALIAAPAAAQTGMVSAASGKSARVDRLQGWTDDCAHLPLDIDIVSPPQHGTLTPRFGTETIRKASIGQANSCMGARSRRWCSTTSRRRVTAALTGSRFASPSQPAGDLQLRRQRPLSRCSARPSPSCCSPWAALPRWRNGASRW